MCFVRPPIAYGPLYGVVVPTTKKMIHAVCDASLRATTRFFFYRCSFVLPFIFDRHLFIRRPKAGRSCYNIKQHL